MQAQDDDRRGFLDSAQTKANISLGLNITAVVVIVLSWLLYITGVVVVVVEMKLWSNEHYPNFS